MQGAYIYKAQKDNLLEYLEQGTVGCH